MKLTKSYIASLLLLSGAFAACDDDPELPPIYVPTADIEANTEIIDLKTKYWSDERNFATQVGKNDEGKDIVIKGRIVSSDSTGNIYKSLVIQSEGENPCALAFSINENDLFEKYKIGQELVVNVTGSYIGKYNGLLQMGAPKEYNGGLETTFMEIEDFEKIAQVNGFSNTAAIDTALVTISDIKQWKNSAADLKQWQSRLVKIENVSFEGGGKAPFSESSASTNRNIVDASGNKLVVRNSSYASFASKTLPAGAGTVVGILSFYGTDWQLLLRSENDCIDFGGDSLIPELPETGGTGEADKPYGVADVLAGKTATGVWVTGYIVGWVNTEGDKFEVSDATATFTTPATNNTNVLLAATADEKRVPYCIPVQLPSGDVRSALNLVDNAGNLGKQVTLKCDITAYFSINGLKNATAYAWGGVGEEKPVGATANFKKATAVTAGKQYIIVANGKMATPLSGEYGYIQTADVTETNGVIAASVDNAFTIASTTGGYTIADASGKYYHLKGTYKSFNVSATMPTEGAAWAITIDANGAATIKNVEKGKTIQFDSQYGSYGAYDEISGTLPSLYEKVD